RRRWWRRLRQHRDRPGHHARLSRRLQAAGDAAGRPAGRSERRGAGRAVSTDGRAALDRRHPLPAFMPAKTVWQGRFLETVVDGRWEYVRRTRGIGAAVILAVTDADEIVLVEQYRVPLGAHC